jgi:hypothetical protein
METNADLHLAKMTLNQKNLSLVIAKNGKLLFETESHGIGDLLKAIQQLRRKMNCSSVADRIVGRAAALLFAYSGVHAVFAIIISESGTEILKSNHIFYEFERWVPCVLDPKRIDVCPFEKLVAEFSNPKEAYGELKARCA